MMIFFIALITCLLLELLYFRIANRFNIIDKPNQRSSHHQITLRGGGIIFPIAAVVSILLFQPHDCWLALGVFLISTISFLDDIITLNNKLRVGIHFISVLLILIQTFLNQNILISSIFSPVSCVLMLIAIVVIIGIINAYNFMDGINGITVLYSLVSVATLFWIQKAQHFTLLDDRVWLAILASLLVFGFFNIRKKAKAFSGDVGSISIAFILCFAILMFILYTDNLKWILLLGIYGLDTVFTICSRLIRGENIFEAHRAHFYQYLANEKKWSHLQVSILYASIQLLLNSCLINCTFTTTLTLFLMIVMLYLILRIKLEGYQKLFSPIRKSSIK